MQSRMLRRLTAAAVLVLVAGVTVVTTAAARPARPGPLARRSAFNLFAGATNVSANVNRVQCNVNNFGNQCVDPNGSPVVGGGFWPKGSPDQYIFNGGLEIGAIVCYDATCSTPGTWKGDTVGVFFMDPRGTQVQGSPLTNVFNSLNADDAANWPTDAYVQDTSLYAPSLIGRATISQQDTWVRYWDGNTSLVSGRKHSMGVLVEQRGVAWNFPSGNEDIIYFLFRFINVTSGIRADYDQLLPAGYSTAQVDAIFAIAQDFRTRAQSAYNVILPAGGFTFHNTFANYFQDADEGDSGFNYSTATLPFAETNVIKSDFTERTWAFPPNIFAAPFAPAPGFEGVKYLKSPINPVTGKQFGISVWSNTCNGCGVLNDAVGVSQMYRYISGTPSPALGDAACTVTPAIYHTCGAIQTPADTRFFMASGPFDMKPGASSVIVVAMVHAAPVASLPPSGTGIFALPAFSLTPYITAGVGTLTPGIPATPESLAFYGGSKVRPIERAEGWASFSDVNGNGIIEQSEVNTVPRSLLDKDKVAQAVFDNKFLLPFAPEAPLFYLVPGDGHVTIAWQKSATETIGDPYFQVAKNPLNADLTANALYDPNYRQFDVEGYRIWRGRTQAEMQVIAQFDYEGTVLNDYTGAVVTSSFGNQCAPELGVTSSCPVAFQFPYAGSAVHNAVPIVGDVVQVPPGGRTLLASGNVFILQADTAVTGGGTGFPTLTDNGVPFAYIDAAARDGFQYYYAVTAFDVNSVKSGPSSLESPLVSKTATPRAPSTNNVPASVIVGVFGDDGTQLNPLSPFPKMDSANGTFNGIIPPTNGGDFHFLASVAEALPPGEYVAKIDSISRGLPASLGTTPTMYVTFSAPGVSQSLSFAVPMASHSDGPTVTGTFGVSTPLVPYDTMRARLVGIPLSFSSAGRMPVVFSATFAPISGGPSATMLCGRGLISAATCGATAQASRYLLHSRWFDEGGAEPPDPTIDFNPSAAHNSGTLTGVTSIWFPLAYRTPLVAGGATEVPAIFRYYAYALSEFHPADFVVTWGAGGAITVRDSTHHTSVPYNQGVGVGYGFISGAAIAAAGVSQADLLLGGNDVGTPTPSIPSYHSIYTVPNVCDGSLVAAFGAAPLACVPLSRTAVLQQLDESPAVPNGAGDGTGIVLMMDGEFFFMKMAALPAAGTKWHLRAVGGLGLTATCTPALPSGTGTLTTPPTDCSNYSYSSATPVRTPMVPGLAFKIVVAQAFEVAAASGDMSHIHTVPDPYYVTNSLEITANTKVLRFVNLPDRAIIRIYSASGILVNVLQHRDAAGGGEAVWNLRNRNNQFVASGVYFYHVEGPDGKTKIGRFTVVNFAQ